MDSAKAALSIPDQTYAIRSIEPPVDRYAAGNAAKDATTVVTIPFQHYVRSERRWRSMDRHLHQANHHIREDNPARVSGT